MPCLVEYPGEVVIPMKCPLRIAAMLARCFPITASLIAGWLALCVPGCGDVSSRDGATPQDGSRGASVAVKPIPKRNSQPRRKPKRMATAPVVQAPQRRRVTPSGPSERIDLERVTALGIRRLQGVHLTLFTDLPPGDEVDVLPDVFDQAVPQWCSYFQRDPADLTGWRLTGYLMQTPQKFRDAGLLPADIGAFLHGYNRGLELWIHEQQTDYYRRHLLLHEGTHGFMDTQLGGGGPPWYMEGVAELLATHTWDEQRLVLREMPAESRATPGWGRIRIIRDQIAAGRSVTLPQIFHFGPRAHREVEPYAWSWAAATFLDSHPRWQAVFRGFQHQTRDSTLAFSERFLEQLGSDWMELAQEWRLFVEELHYGYDVPRSAFIRRAAQEVPSDGAVIQVATDRGWQSTGWQINAGATYSLTAEGRYQLDDQPRVWWCEPEGVTIRYHRGHPLGMLLAATVSHPNGNDEFAESLLQPIALGRSGTLTSDKDALLYLAINEPSKGLANNKGAITVRIQRQRRGKSIDALQTSGKASSRR